MTAPGAAAGADCDVLIAGGGMVGASLAVALAGLPLRVTLVEAIPAVPGPHGLPGLGRPTARGPAALGPPTRRCRTRCS